tara:strand:+ start:68 stop:637 length:570 start_codon:yes stop_codon:yes gene_type:complete
MPNPYLEDSSFHSVASIPGQSFTDTPGSKPYERPPAFAEPERAFGLMVKQLQSPLVRKDIVGLLDAGISAETISSALVMQAFTEGLITPDVAEIIKQPLMRVILRIGLDNGVQDMNVVNELPKDGMSEEDSMTLMRTINPNKFERQMAAFDQAQGEELMAMEEMNNMSEMQDSMAPQEGFITRDNIEDM